MKNLNLIALKIAIVAVLLPAVMLTSCKKDEVPPVPEIQTEKLSEDEFSRLLKFISITTTAPKEEIVYDAKTQEFIVYGWFRKSLKDARSQYEMANEYKATYEK